MTHHPHRAKPDDPQHPADRIAYHITRARKRREQDTVRLEDLEQQMLRQFLRDYTGDPRDAGAAALMLGQLLADLIAKAGAASGHIPPQALVNLLRMIGERLWTDHLPTSVRCPYELAGGIDCNYLCEAPDAHALDVYMRAHVGLHHPDQTWPPPGAEQELLDETVVAAAFAVEAPRTDPETGEALLRQRPPAERLQYLLDHREETIAKGVPAEFVDQLIGEATADAATPRPLGFTCCTGPDCDAQIPTLEGEGADHLHAAGWHWCEKTATHPQYLKWICPGCRVDHKCAERAGASISVTPILDELADFTRQLDGEGDDD